MPIIGSARHVRAATFDGSETGTMDQLKQTLQQLHQQLERTDDIDPELQQWLRVLDEDIHKLLAARGAEGASDAEGAGDAPASTDDDSDDENLATRADDIARRFATRHPQLEPVLRQISDALARLGI
jgi:ABC-type transporter Mla subunit MlaD